MKGKKNDFGKLRYSLLPPNEMEEVIKALMHGSKKYEDWNWQKVVKENKWRYFDAMERHIKNWQKGETRDKDSGLHPLAHAICCCLFLLWYDNNRKSIIKEIQK